MGLFTSWKEIRRTLAAVQTANKKWYPQTDGGVAELADAADSKSAGALLCVGSTPSIGTCLAAIPNKQHDFCIFIGFLAVQNRLRYDTE